jgi:toxin HigB-1
MIRSFRHKGLKRLYESGNGSGVRADQVARLEEILTVLDTAATPQDVNLPGYRLHRLSGDLKGLWSITVRANWRIVFRIADGEIWDVELIDYR